MNYYQLLWKNLLANPLKTVFNVMLVSIAVSLVLIILLINKQFGNHLGKSSENIDFVLAAKGSPLQSVLCNVLQVDAPTGNIKVGEIQAFLNPAHPLIKNCAPLALGDSYKSYRLVGTSLEYFEWQNLKLSEGRFFDKENELVIGNEIAIREKIKLGDTLHSNHGLVNLDMEHEHALIVTGILTKTNSISNKLIFTSISTYWDEHNHSTDSDSNSMHESPILRNQDLIQKDKEISSVLIQFRGKNIQTLNFGRSINENTNIMGVYPAIEISRLYELTNSASDLLYWIAVILGILSSIALFINLVQALEDRKLELAIMRIGGARPGLIFKLLIAEGLSISLIGCLFGLVLAHGFLYIASQYFQLGSKYGISGTYFMPEEIFIVILTLICGMFASIIPAYRAYKQDIASTISN
ncbi:MAG: FtsX-like permease family protein [Saprospiraceae bacterium]